jgi:hypothetical protein
MFRRSTNAGDAQARLSLNSWDRLLPVKIAGFAIFISAALLLLGGAYREQANMISTGLLLLSIGALFVPGLIRKSWIMKVAFFALIIIGVFYALTT